LTRVNSGTFAETAESVLEGHPDKVADQIADAILDFFLSRDPFSKVGCEVLVSHRTIVIAGEFSRVDVDLESVVRTTLRTIGYDSPESGMDADSVDILLDISRQSKELSTFASNKTSGDQCTTIGYATDETPELMPFPILMSNKLAKEISILRKSKTLDYLGPDGKVQLTVEFRDNKPVHISDVTISVQRSPRIEIERLRADLKTMAIGKVVPKWLLDDSTKIFVNHMDDFFIGGPMADTGLTGRKLLVDAYGPRISTGGGGFSGKDGSKADRTGAYFARFLAKNAVASGLTNECVTEIVFMKGFESPLHFRVDSIRGTENSDSVKQRLAKSTDMKFESMINSLNLRKPGFSQTACYGHFGREDFAWESLGLVDSLTSPL
jgi:S-adenosylmethionine synthetase